MKNKTKMKIGQLKMNEPYIIAMNFFELNVYTNFTNNYLLKKKREKENLFESLNTE